MANRPVSGAVAGAKTELSVVIQLPPNYIAPVPAAGSTYLRISTAISVPPPFPPRKGLQRLSGGARIEILVSRNPDAWVDVTCQVISARVSWGTQKSEGIISQSAPGTIEAEVFDPNRILDPTNTASPYYGLLRPGLHIRLFYNDFLIRSGYVDSLAHTVSTKLGRIRANDWLSLLANFPYPNEFVYVPPNPRIDSLHAFASDLIADAWKYPGVVPPITVETYTPAILVYVPAGNYMPGSLGPNVMSHIASKATSVLHYMWLDRNNVLRFRDATYGHTPGIALGVSGPLPLDFVGSVDTSGIYNSIYVAEEEHGATWSGFDSETVRSIFMWGTKRWTSPPIPRKSSGGKYSLLEYATLVWQDRSQPSFEALPVRIWPASASELETLVALEAMQTVVMQFDAVTPAINLVGRLLGEVVNVDPDGWSVELATWIPA